MEERNYKISVAMATYNGEKYIKEQLESIISNLLPQDEIIISDDGSTDNTRKVIEKLECKMIKIIDGPKNGVKKNFENAIKNCSGKYIFLSDQDDIWEKDKVKQVIEVLEEGYDLVVHDAVVINGDNSKVIMPSWFEYRNSKKGIIKNILKNAYQGACMCFSREMLPLVLPIPNNIYMHDQWIGLIIQMKGKVKFLDSKLLYYRRHEENVSSFKSDSTFVMIKKRTILIYELIKYKFKNNKNS